MIKILEALEDVLRKSDPSLTIEHQLYLRCKDYTREEIQQICKMTLEDLWRRHLTKNQK